MLILQGPSAPTRARGYSSSRRAMQRALTRWAASSRQASATNLARAGWTSTVTRNTSFTGWPRRGN